MSYTDLSAKYETRDLQSTVSIRRKRAVGVTTNAVVVRRDFVPKRHFAVLDSTGNGKNAVASTRGNASGVEHVHALFSVHAVGRIFLRITHCLGWIS